MIHAIAVIGLASVASYLVVTYHSAVVAKLKAEVPALIAATRSHAAIADKFENDLKAAKAYAELKSQWLVKEGEKAGSYIAENVKVEAGKIVSDVKADAEKVEAKL
jgi:hypothetical protein